MMQFVRLQDKKPATQSDSGPSTPQLQPSGQPGMHELVLIILLLYARSACTSSPSSNAAPRFHAASTDTINTVEVKPQTGTVVVLQPEAEPITETQPAPRKGDRNATRVVEDDPLPKHYERFGVDGISPVNVSANRVLEAERSSADSTER